MRLGSTSLNVTNRSGGGGPLAAAAPTPTYSLTSNSTVNEGFAFLNTVNTNHVADGTTLHWRVDHGTTNDDDFAAISGTTTINVPHGGTTGSGTFIINVEADALTEGNTSETFTVIISLAANGAALDSNNVSINDTSKTATYSLTESATSVDEGSSLTFTVSTTNVPPNDILYWGVVHDSTNSFDFTTSQGQLTVNNAPNFTDTFTVTPDADQLTDPNETFDVHLYTDAARTNSVASVTGIQVGDASTTPPAPPTYTLSVPPNTVLSEGSQTTVTLTTTNLVTGTAYWSIDSTHAGDFQTSSGTFNILNSTATVNLLPLADQQTENTEVCTISVYDSNQAGATAKHSLQIPIADTSQTPATYVIAPASSSVNEGSGLNFTVTTTNVPNTTNLYWFVNGVTPSLQNRNAADPNTDFVHSSGSFQIQNNSHTFTVSIAADAVAEMSGGEEFNVEIRTDQNDVNSVVATSSTVVINEPTFALSAPSLNVDEGSTLVHTVTTTNFGATNSGTLYWKITSNASDFAISQNSVNVVNGTASFDITPDEDQNNEPAENFTVALYLDSNYTPGEELATLTSSINATTYALSVQGGATSVDEGSTLTFNVDATNAYNTTLYWKITPAATDPITLSDFHGATNGSVVVDSAGQATFTITADADLTTENGPEYFNVELHTDSAMSGTPADSVTGLAINDTSLDPTWNLSTSNPAVNEGSLITFNLVTTGVPDQTLYWTVEGVATANLTPGRSAASAADFNNVTSGSWNHSGGSSSFQVGPLADTTTEGEEEFVVKVRTGSNSGTVVADLEPILINDTSMAAAAWTMVSNNGTSSVDEGGSFRVDVTGTNIAGTPTPQWLIRTGGGSTVDQNNTTEFYAYTGTLSNLTQNGNTWTGYFEVFPRNDNTTEGDEIMYIDLYSDNSYGTQLTDSNGNGTSIGPITVGDTSLSQTATMTPAGGTTVDEGAVMTVNVTTTGYQSNKTFYWEIVSNSNYNLTVTPSSDFQHATGQFSIGSVSGQYGEGTGSFQITCTADQATEGDEKFDIALYDDVNRTNKVGDLYGLTVHDTSVAAPASFNLTYHGYGSNIRLLYIMYVRSSNNAVTVLGSIGGSGQTHSSHTASWSTATYSLSSFTGIPGRVAIVAQGVGSQQYQGDWGISGEYQRADGVTENYSANFPNGWRHNFGYSSANSAAAATASTQLTYNVGLGWGLITGGTPSSGTGPSAAPSGSGPYIYLETSGYSHGNQYTFSALKMSYNITP